MLPYKFDDSFDPNPILICHSTPKAKPFFFPAHEVERVILCSGSCVRTYGDILTVMYSTDLQVPLPSRQLELSPGITAVSENLDISINF
jgi:uncharacterized membrane protein